MDDDYAQVARGPLKLKKDSEMKKKKKKKCKSKDKEKMEKVLIDKPPAEDSHSKAPVRQLTKAELAFKKMQEKIVSVSFVMLREILILFLFLIFYSKRNASNNERL